MDEIARLQRQMAVLIERQEHMLQDLTEMKAEMKEIIKGLMDNGRFVTRREFVPIQRIVYGAVGIILVTVLGALLVLIISSTGGVTP